MPVYGECVSVLFAMTRSVVEVAEHRIDSTIDPSVTNLLGVHCKRKVQSVQLSYFFGLFLFEYSAGPF